MTEQTYRKDFEEHFTYAAKTNRLAIVSFVLAALAMAGFIFGSFAVLAVFSVGAAHVALGQIRSSHESGSLLARTALVVSYLIAAYALGSAIYFAINVT